MTHTDHPLVASDFIRQDVARDGNVTTSLIIRTNMPTTPDAMGYDSGQFDELVLAALAAIERTGADRAEIIGPH